MNRESDKGKYTTPDGVPTWEYIAAVSCALLLFCTGCIPGWNSPTLSILMGPDSPIPLTSDQASTLSALLSLGYMISPLIAIIITDRLTRKNCLIISGLPMLINWGLIIIANHVVVLYVARFISGMTAGLTLCLAPMYLGEIASVKLRGALGMVCGTMMNAGTLFMFAVAPYLSVRTMACISLSIAIISVVSIWFIPESPYFLAMVGKFDDAEENLEKLRGKTNVIEEMDLIKKTVSKSDDNTEYGEENKREEKAQILVGFKKLFTVTTNRKALWINLLFSVVLQLGGYVPLVIYCQIIFEAMHTNTSAYGSTIVQGVLQLIFNVLIAFIVDRVGRRPLILLSGSLSGICLLIVGLYFYLMEYTAVNVSAYSMLALVATFIYLVAINIGLMPLQMVIQSEILATEVKASAGSMIIAFGGVLSTISLKFYLQLAVTWGFGHSVPFIGFAVVTWLGTVMILGMLPETKGKNFIEIQRSLYSR